MQVSTGITISFASSFLAEILDVSPPNPSRESIQTSHQGTTDAHSFTPAKLVDWGELNCNIGFDPDEDPPIGNTEETITITFASGATWEFTGFMTSYEPTAPFEQRMTADVTIKVDGDVEVTPAS